jgi:exodeoxyribonuclease VII large subunit
MQHPRTQLAQQAQQLDDLSESLQNAFFSLLSDKKHQLKYATQGLLNNRPDQFIDYQKIQLDDLASRLRYISEQQLETRQQQLAHLCRTLQAVSPLNTLSRGYSITQTIDGKTITDADQAQPGELIISRLHHGEIKSRVE